MQSTIPEFPDLKARLARSNTSNPRIDAQARLKAMQEVWDLLTRFPLVERWKLTLFDARRAGIVESLTRTDSFYQQLGEFEFPSNPGEWELLAICAIEACTGIRVTPQQLLDAEAVQWGKAKAGSIAQQNYEAIKNRYY